MHFGSRINSTFSHIIAAAGLTIGAGWLLATAALAQDASSSSAAAPSSAASSAASSLGSSAAESSLASSASSAVDASSSALDPAVAAAAWQSPSLSIFFVLVGVVLGGIAMFYAFTQKGQPGLTLSDSEKKVFAATTTIATTTSVFAVAGVLILGALCLGFAVNDAWKFLSFLGTDLFVGAAAAAVGSLTGFIFGIPRTREAADQVASGTTEAVGEKQKSKAALLANTNLERISDWLTTLLIGATLVQINKIPGLLQSVGGALKDGIDNGDVIPFVLIYFFGLAFLGIYLITRLYLTATLKQALGLEDGVDHVGPDTAGASAKLKGALETNDPAQVLAAIQYVDRSHIHPNQTGDLDFSLTLARALIKILKAGNADDASQRKADLKTVVGVIAADKDTADLLKTDFAGGVTSGDAPLDAELKKTLGA